MGRHETEYTIDEIENVEVRCCSDGRYHLWIDGSEIDVFDRSGEQDTEALKILIMARDDLVGVLMRAGAKFSD